MTPGAPVQVTVRGELDSATAHILLDTLAAHAEPAAAAGVLAVDLTSVSFCDVAGVHALIRMQAESDRLGVDLRLLPSPFVARVLELCGTSLLAGAGHRP